MPALDTARLVRDLERGGFGREQAEALAAALFEITANLATKDDLKDLATKAELQAVRVDLENRIALTERDLKIWSGRMVAWQISATAAIVGIATALIKLV